ncbi:S26 family signal peptidase [Brevundimonas sp. Leaf363]|uniref:signal peptidase I n=1 Tax=Brevundimonas sp. Leaf363 TaxID=1736353 RepID=UPI0006FA49B3|nr:signal peptidase I [Brevundimonas sp. Leaf363]KQS55167.1 S26 family signal peptidase [Brevundimonas sp. Leaf363]
MTETPETAADPWAEILDTVRTLIIGLAAALTLHAVFLQPFTIPSSSMEPGLRTGDYIVVSKPTYGWSLASVSFSPWVSGRVFGRDPKRGDVVVFRLPRDPKQAWIKRVIGLPGDRVQMIGGQVVVNGQPWAQEALDLTVDLDRPERVVRRVRETQPSGRSYVTYDGGQTLADDTGVYEVPAGQYLVMGDNRDNSLDGRFPADVGVGLLPASNLVGKAEWVLASWKPGAGLFKPWTWLNLRGDRFFKRIQ